MTRALSVGLAVGAALIGVTAAPLASRAAGSEQRCNELGAGCICSEPLNNNTNISALPSRYWNPPDTTTKQCDGEQGNGAFMTLPQNYSLSAMLPAASVRPFPSGANPFIYRGGMAGISHYTVNSIDNVSNETVCIRAYRRYSDGFRVSNLATERLKIITLTRNEPGGAHADMQFGWDGKSAHIQVVDTGYSAPDESRGDLDFQSKCSDVGWCRLEICADHQGSSLQYRFYVTSLTTGATNSYIFNGGTGPTVTHYTGGNLSGIMAFSQGLSNGFQYMSYSMMARVPVNPNFKIGPAYELEGSIGNPPPPPPAPPVAPVLSQ